ncbi:Met-10+ like-protein-domain-containing protein [Clohesyomyces aquaticus]|uniref:tRNA (guanine(37)-N1)-methyltransferase n=1 Tax=Clohesyomyces aquaticus TaxID=1231657 RepID=A0A1Y1ZXL5_9PLEO|nr:Met-10+ like-protein-domain-containing protein [Clohesyomyces aquaticus]
MSADMLLPPVNRAMRVLDRGFFQKTMPTSAARIFNTKDISRSRIELERGHDHWTALRIQTVRPDPSEERAAAGGKCILLRPEVLHNDPNTWSPRLRDLERAGTVGVVPYELRLDYSYFSYAEIMYAILPHSEAASHDEVPTGFSMAGHVAHLNLRDKYLPYKHLIAQVLADKNGLVRTVINKLDNVGQENAYRTFQYEVLYGPDDMNVTVLEQGCTFTFDFAKVYWNSRLHTEHERLCSSFQEGEAVCDVMAGVGPFAIPAGKKKCFVWANDLNPESYKYLQECIAKNKVGNFVQPFNEDGHKFIRTATSDLLQAQHSVPIYPKTKQPRKDKTPIAPLKTLVQPQIFSHYVMNLPASAIEFLPSFIGLYSNIPGVPASDIRQLFTPHTNTKLPMIHVYCFSTKSDDNVAESLEICAEISRQLGHGITPETPEVRIWDVRDVAPKKRMFCASFRLPEEVAFRRI